MKKTQSKTEFKHMKVLMIADIHVKTSGFKMNFVGMDGMDESRAYCEESDGGRLK